MNRFSLAAIFAVSAMSTVMPAFADSMLQAPFSGTCRNYIVRGHEDERPPHGYFIGQFNYSGVHGGEAPTEINVSREDYTAYLEKEIYYLGTHPARKPGEFVDAGSGELSLKVRFKDDTVTIRGDDDNIHRMFSGMTGLIDRNNHTLWGCETSPGGPNFNMPMPF